MITTRLTSSIPFESTLIEVLKDVHNEVSHLNVTLRCQDGSLMTCGMLLAAVSPVIKHIGTVTHDPEEVVIFLPDYAVKQVYSFVSLLTSAEGPRPGPEAEMFQDILTFLGKEPPNHKTAPMIEPILPLIVQKEDLSLTDDIVAPYIKEEPFENLSSKDLLGWDDSFSSSQFDDDVNFYGGEEEEEDEEEEEEEEGFRGPYRKRKAPKGGGLEGRSKLPPVELEQLNEDARQCYNLERGIYLCFQCGTERKNTRSMQQHLLWHKKYPDEDFHTSHICKECGKVCADHSLLRAHVRLVHSPRTFNCPEDDCTKSFKSKEGLKQHLLVHSGVKNFICSECGYAVRTKHHLKLHVLKRHTEVKKSIPCEVCGKLFRHMSNLKCHFYTHKARLEREHRCEMCSLTFRTQKSYDSHMALHDPSRPFKCSKCPLRYKNKDALVAHENTHENLQYKCDYCDITYTRKDNLKRHVKEKHSQLGLIDKVIMGSSGDDEKMITMPAQE